MNLQTIESIVSKYRDEQGSLMSILGEIQSLYSYLPEAALRKVADMTGKPLVDVYGVATFYRSFTLRPRGKHLCSVCVGTACHVRGAEAVAGDFEKRLGVAPGETTPDREFTLERVACLGACALGPIVVVDGHYFSNVKRRDVKTILDKARSGLHAGEMASDERVFPVDVSCPKCNHSLMDPTVPIDGQPSIHISTSFQRKNGWARLSRLYGSFNTVSEPEIPLSSEVDIFCPHCHASLRSSTSCGECGTDMFVLIVRQGGVIQVCSRRGCKGHLLDLDGVNA